MNMNAYNATIVTRLLIVIRAFKSGRFSLDEIQSALQSAISLFEQDGSGVASLVRLAEADLEEIRFTVLHGEQRQVASSRLAELRSALEGDADG